MVSKIMVSAAALGALASMAFIDGTSAAAQDKKATAEKNVPAETCYECHEPIKELHLMGKHRKVNCASCHSGLAGHLAAPGPETRPSTNMSWKSCGTCHQDQYDSFMQQSYHRPARDEKSQLTNRSPNPYWDKLMAGHGFTKEHNLTRSHINMLVDQFVVDRAFGGRFQGKNGWTYILEKGKVWDVLQDTHPESNEQKPFLPQSATAANPVCLQCKTQDNILKWAYMGDNLPGTEWSRESNVVDLVRGVEYGLNCFTCHDPHAAKPRIVRDALIDTLTQPDGDTLWHKDPQHTNFKVIEMGLRGFTRKIALLDRYDSRLLCGQCHVEYNCNPGTDTKSGDKVTMADRRTNHFPYKDVLELYEHYTKKVNFLDFKHALTGGMLWKAQHPETETFYNSKHAKAGVGCDTCHTPKLKNKAGKVYTSHFAVTPRVQLKETCLQCHPEWTAEQAVYAIDSIKAHIRGKMRKAEFWLSALIDKIVAAKTAGVDPEVIKKAQDQHLKAHILWEYWTAENSDGFHNPELAKESLTRSVNESQEGIKVITEAMAPKPVAAK